MQLLTRTFAVAVLLGVTIVATAASAAVPPPGRLKVTATVFPLADIVRQIGGNRVHVVTLVRPGIRPSEYQPNDVQIRQTTGTALYVRVGNGFDTWGDTLFGTAGQKPLTITVSDIVESLPHNGITAVSGTHTACQTGTNDAWAWLDPILVRDRILPAVTSALLRMRPGDAHYFKVNERKYFVELTKLDQAMWSVFRKLPGKGFVTTHAIWGYLAKRYGLRQLSVIDPPAAATTTQQCEDNLVEAAQKSGIVAVFGVPWSKVAPAQLLADRIHGSFVLLDPLGGEQFPGRHNYVALMRFNLALIKHLLPE